MICFPNAKINIGLNITEKRKDGYHNLETVFYPITLCDSLEIIENKESNEPYIWSSSGLVIDGDTKDNLCIKALLKLKEDFDIPPIKIHLHKVIPFGAGIGGGSADAAFTLSTINTLFKLGLSKDELIAYAAKIGADCAFFILNKSCFASGIGEKLQAIDLNLQGYHLVLIKPNVHISTAEAFSGITPQKPKHPIKDAINEPLENWTTLISNDFEPGILNAHPDIKAIKEEFYNQGAIYASMTGSGAAVYGIFKDKPEIKMKDCYVWQTDL
ncbi:4-(cytidine 5'-diphospho)-2-C-methyl-D-erythritol kinase [Saccharicrinis aurantiacus]|uniref:4-(cytidine 5'-diphospho)-2-C-methyl-D-erythritol kinase n=1 Tax=Saccharicrinis aurantiacus TaxID=1849719 RepID=UPI0024920DA0|nr:4-(cytidine 5'-diphospho)-2-C-methyl-D-erythritol kinase [Saccharicrinis aurantiacus]